MDNRARNGEGKLKESVGEAEVVDPAEPGMLQVTFLPEALRWPFTKGDYWILRVDEDYRTAVVGSPDFQYLWLLHREPALDDGMRESYLQYAQSVGYQLDDLVHTPHTDRRTA